MKLLFNYDAWRWQVNFDTIEEVVEFIKNQSGTDNYIQLRNDFDFYQHD